MRIYIAHYQDKAKRLKTQRVFVYECKLKLVSVVLSEKENIRLYKDVMRKIGKDGIRIVITQEELEILNGIAEHNTERGNDGF